MSTTDYSLARAYKRIERILIDSMIRNLKKHKADERKEGLTWDQWQVVQLEELERYRLQNQDKFDEDFADIHQQVDKLFRTANKDAQTKEEAEILDRIRKGQLTRPSDTGIGVEIFNINEQKLNALINATTQDLEKAEHAILRRANDAYRKVIFDAQMYAASGGTYKQAVEMALQDFGAEQVKQDAQVYQRMGMTYEQAVDKATENLVRYGLRPIVYKNGARHNLSDYAAMALRTGNKRAYLLGEGQKHAEYGIHTVKVNKRPEACPLCLRWTGRVLIDDVYGGGTVQEAEEKRLPLLSTAMKLGFLHPNCKDIYSLYIEGVSKPADPWTEEEIRELAGDYNHKQALKRAQENADMFQRLAETRLDPDNRRKAEAKAKEWKERVEVLKRRGAGDGPVSVDSNTRYVKTIDFSDKDQVYDLLDQAEKNFTGLDHERCVTITSDGKVWYTVSTGASFDLDIPSDMRGSYSYHNHPTADTRHSFSERDVATFLSNQEAYAKASDEQYEYEMIRTPETRSADWFEVFGRHKELQVREALDIVREMNLPADEHLYHEAMKILAKEYGFIYIRNKIEY